MPSSEGFFFEAAMLGSAADAHQGLRTHGRAPAVPAPAERINSFRSAREKTLVISAWDAGNPEKDTLQRPQKNIAAISRNILKGPFNMFAKIML